MIKIYYDYHCEVVSETVLNMKAAYDNIKATRKRWPDIKVICLANEEYLTKEKLKIRFDRG